MEEDSFSDSADDDADIIDVVPPQYPSEAAENYIQLHLNKVFPYKTSPPNYLIDEWCSCKDEPEVDFLLDKEFWFKEAHLLLEMFEKDLTTVNILNCMVGLYNYYA